MTIKAAKTAAELRRDSAKSLIGKLSLAQIEICDEVLHKTSESFDGVEKLSIDF